MIRAAVTTAPYLVNRRTRNNDYDLIARKTQMDNILFIPGLDRPNPNNLFRDGQVGGWLDPYDLTKMWVDNAGTTPMTASDLGVGIGRIQSKGGPVITFEQATSGDRPVWGRHPASGVRNLLTFSTQLNNAAWTKVGSTIAVDVATAPDGELTADAIVENTATSVHAAEHTFTSLNAAYTFQARIKPNGRTIARLRFFDGIGGHATFFNLTGAGSVGTNAAGNTATITALPDGWYRCTISRTMLASVAALSQIGPAATDGVSSYLGDGVSGILVGGTQLELGTTATTIQSSTNRFDITEAGQPDLYYFDFNGVNQSWASNATVDFSTTDKVTVWAGLRKLSDVATGYVVELTSGPSNGSFGLRSPGTDGANEYRFTSRGTSLSQAIATTYAAPTTNKVVGQGRISSDLSSVTVDGVEFTTLTDQGTGNYSNATLFIGRRNNATGPLNAYLYSLIIAGDNYDIRTIQRFSDWTLKPRRLITA